MPIIGSAVIRVWPGSLVGWAIPVARPIVWIRAGGDGSRGDCAGSQAECQSGAAPSASPPAGFSRCGHRRCANCCDRCEDYQCLLHVSPPFKPSETTQTVFQGCAGTRGSTGAAITKKTGLPGTNGPERSLPLKCSNLARGESMKDPVSVLGCWRGFHFGRTAPFRAAQLANRSNDCFTFSPARAARSSDAQLCVTTRR